MRWHFRLDCVFWTLFLFQQNCFFFFYLRIVERDLKQPLYTSDSIDTIQKKVSGFCNIFDENGNYIYYNKKKKIIEWKDLSFMNKNNIQCFIFSIKFENGHFLIHTYPNEGIVFSYNNDTTKLEVAEYILFWCFCLVFNQLHISFNSFQTQRWVKKKRLL